MGDERKADGTVRVFVHRNEPGAEGQVMKVPATWNFKRFKKSAGKKVKLKNVKRVFLASGIEITGVEDMEQGDMLFCSDGGPFYKNSRTASAVETLNVAVLGAGHVGKSALTLRFVRDFFVQDWDPTIEDAYRKNLPVGDRTVQLEILDTAGQDDFESLRPQWMMERDAYVFVFALDQGDSLRELDPFYELHRQINETKRVPIVLCGTKSDIVKLEPKKRQVSEAVARETAERFGAKYIETSAFNGENVEEVFRLVVREVWGNKPAPKKEKKGWWCNIL